MCSTNPLWEFRRYWRGVTINIYKYRYIYTEWKQKVRSLCFQNVQYKSRSITWVESSSAPKASWSLARCSWRLHLGTDALEHNSTRAKLCSCNTCVILCNVPFISVGQCPKTPRVPQNWINARCCQCPGYSVIITIRNSKDKNISINMYNSDRRQENTDKNKTNK